MSQLHLIPRPRKCEVGQGRYAIAPQSRITHQGGKVEDLAQLLAEYLAPATGDPAPVAASDTPGDIHLHQTAADTPDDAGFCDEAYTLTVDDGGVRIVAATSHGVARGIQTLRQLLDPGVYEASTRLDSAAIPHVAIEDHPRFRWRGLHLDVSRHFFSVDQVCHYIELLAQHRYNICHLHLTDDQGWRIEIKQYPRLVEVGSKRDCTLVGHHRDRPRRYDDQPYAGHYTQDDIRRIVAFARQRRVTLVPEIDMPGHMSAAITAYPELGNYPDRQLAVRTHWGISQSVLNVEPATVTFMQNVLDEVMGLFPGLFIHIGGDEAPKVEWSECRRAQQRMAELGLGSEDELQSWFIRQMDQHITAAGRRLIGWDEILEGGLAENAAVMSWRGEAGGIEAARQGHEVVMAPNKFVYFDHGQIDPAEETKLNIGGHTPLEKVYGYEPIPADLGAEQAPLVLGAQGQLWTEYIADPSCLYYMAYPRACALAEVLWDTGGEREYGEFLGRLTHHRQRLERAGCTPHPRP